MKEKLSAAGAVVIAVLASSCCWAPLLLAGLGAGAGYPLAGGGFASALGPYRPYLLAMTFVLLAGAWYFTLRKRPVPAAAAAGTDGRATGDACCAQKACCAPTRARRRNILLLSGVTAFALAMLAFPQISTVLARSQTSDPPIVENSGPAETVTLAIQGMTCEACALHLKRALVEIPGVVAAEVDYPTASARVTIQKDKVSTDQLRQTVAKTGYTVTSVTPSTAASPAPGRAFAASAERPSTVLLGIEGMT